MLESRFFCILLLVFFFTSFFITFFVPWFHKIHFELHSSITYNSFIYDSFQKWTHEFLISFFSKIVSILFRFVYAHKQQAVIEKFNLCEDNLSGLLKWIAQVEQKIASVGGPKERIDELRNQINVLKVIFRIVLCSSFIWFTKKFHLNSKSKTISTVSHDRCHPVWNKCVNSFWPAEMCSAPPKCRRWKVPVGNCEPV